MRFLAATSGALVAITTLALSAAADEVPMVLCGGAADGIRDLASAASGPSDGEGGLAVTIVESPHSKDNLMKLAGGDCDAAIVDVDMLMLYKADHMAGQLSVAAPLFLFDKHLHMVCRRESGIESIDDLLREPERYRLLSGAAGSSSEITWQALSKLDPDYARIATRTLGGSEALAALAVGNDADCMAVMDNVNSAFMAEVEAAGSALRLVAIDLWQLRDAEMVDNRVYRSAVIPPDAYANLQKGLDEPSVETIAVQTMLLVSRDWVRAHPTQHEALSRAAADARKKLSDGARQ